MFHLIGFLAISQGKRISTPPINLKQFRRLAGEFGDYWKIVPPEDRDQIMVETSLGLRTNRGYLPEDVHWYPTYACNFRCIHCSRAEEKYDLFEHLLEKTNLSHVSIVGGEPFILPEMLGIMEFLAENRVYFLVVTNGWFVDRKVADKLESFGVYLNHVEVSLDGATPETHDYYRGKKGAFARALRAIRLLRERNILVLPQACIHGLNKGEIARVWDVAVKQGKADHFRVIPLMRDGRGTNPEIAISDEEINQVYLELKKKFEEYKSRVYISRPWRCLEEMQYEKSVQGRPGVFGVRPAIMGGHLFGGCTSYLTDVSIEPDGSFYPCGYLTKGWGAKGWEVTRG